MKRLLFALILFTKSLSLSAQDNRITRIARITVDSTQLEAYKKLLKTQMETAVQKEPGVISYKVYEDKAAPYKLTIIELYADNNAYLAHRGNAAF